jgi:hypothetical protein
MEAPVSNNDNYDFTLAVQPVHKSLTQDSWLLDSTASTHIVNNKSLFHQYNKTPGHKVKGLSTTSGIGCGTIKISLCISTEMSNITLKNAFYIPTALHNLICLRKIHHARYKLQFPMNKLDINIVAPNGQKIHYGH